MNNLSAEMARYGVTISDIQLILGCSDKTVRNKLNGISEFTICEALKVRNQFFNGMRLEYLFSENESTGSGDKKGA